MPQQPGTIELTVIINDKTFPIGSFTVNIPAKVTHDEVTTYKVGDAYTTPKPPSTDELITRFTNAIKAFKTAFETNPNRVGAVKS